MKVACMSTCVREAVYWGMHSSLSAPLLKKRKMTGLQQPVPAYSCSGGVCVRACPHESLPHPCWKSFSLKSCSYSSLAFPVSCSVSQQPLCPSWPQARRKKPKPRSFSLSYSSLTRSKVRPWFQGWVSCVDLPFLPHALTPSDRLPQPVW